RFGPWHQAGAPGRARSPLRRHRDGRRPHRGPGASDRLMPLPLRTERLVIRPYRDDDATPLHEVFGSPEVMKWTPSAPSKDVAETAQRLARTMAFTARQPPGLGLWALELKD